MIIRIKNIEQTLIFIAFQILGGKDTDTAGG